MKQLMILLMFLVTSSLFAQIEVVRDENTQQAYVRTRSKVDALFARMTLDEKVAQLCGIRPHLSNDMKHIIYE